MKTACQMGIQDWHFCTTRLFIFEAAKKFDFSAFHSTVDLAKLLAGQHQPYDALNVLLGQKQTLFTSKDFSQTVLIII